jgi:hypothetical protein
LASFIIGADRGQPMLLPSMVEDYVAPDAAVQVIDAFVASLDLHAIGFERAAPPRIRVRCCGSTSTATSTTCARRGGWSGPATSRAAPG